MRLDRGALLRAGALMCLAVAAALGAVGWLAGQLGGDRIDASALSEIGELRNRAVVAFTIAKTINAALSVAEEVTVSGGVGVAGVGVSPGQVLDPVDDLIEQFSIAMLIVAVIAQSLEMLLPIGAAWGFGPILATALFALALGVLLGSAGSERAAGASRRFGRALIVLALLFRFGVPAATVATDWVASEFLDGRYAAAQEGIGTLAERADAVAESAREVQVEGESEGLIGRFVDRMSGGLSDLGAALSLLRTNFDEAFQDIVTLLVVFLLETLLLPLFFLWLAWRLFRALVAGAAGRGRDGGES